MHCVCTFLSAVSFMGAALADRLAQDLAAWREMFRSPNNKERSPVTYTLW
jgi:hypothetical protein